MSNRVANKDAWKYVDTLEDFTGSSMWGEWLQVGHSSDDKTWVHYDLYCVFSYGSHFPMYVFDKAYGGWLGNEDKYSRSTTRHQSQTRPDNIKTWLSTDDMKKVIRFGGLAQMTMAKAER